MIRIYLASRYTRGPELREYKKQLEEMGCNEITSRWLLGNHQIDDTDTMGDKAKQEQKAQFAQEDLDDLCRADICISFTEQPRSGHSRGGRHVEFGAALAMGKRCVVIGPRENVFHCLPCVEVYANWEEFMFWEQVDACVFAAISDLEGAKQ